MGTVNDLVKMLKAELKVQGITYAQLAQRLQMSESSVKRMFSASGDMSLSRLDEVCKAMNLDFAELARQFAESKSRLECLTLAQEKALVADPRLLLVSLCCQSYLSVQEMVDRYTLSEVECIHYLTKLDRLGIIELRPGNRYGLIVDRGARPLSNGPALEFLRECMFQGFFSGAFDGPTDMLSVQSFEIGEGTVIEFRSRLEQLVRDFARKLGEDRGLEAHERQACTLVVGMRSWLPPVFAELRRDQAVHVKKPVSEN